MSTSRIYILFTLFLVLTMFTLPGCGNNGPSNSVPQDTPKILVAPTSIDFSTVVITPVPPPEITVTISNTGNANLNIGNIASANPLAAPFAVVSDTCSNQTLTPADNCIVTVSYSPTLVGIPDTDSFDIPSNDPATPAVTVDVSGTGSAVPVPNINVSPTSLDFGEVIRDTAAPDKIVTISNTGTEVLNITSISSLAAPYTLVETCSGLSPLNPSTSCTVTVGFTPTATGSFPVSFNIDSDDPDTTTVTVDVSGNGVIQNIVATPTLLDFGSRMLGSATNLTVTVSNDGSADLIVGTIVSPAAPFTIASQNCSGQTLAPAASCTVTIRYSPTTTGLHSDSFDIPSDDPDTATVTVAVSGNGMPPNPVTLSEDTIVVSNSLLSAVDNTDYWSFAATAGEVYSVEIFGTRLDQEGWHLGSNLPHVKFLDPTGVDLLAHHFDNSLITDPWLWGAHDLDIPMFYAKQDATYFIAISKEYPTDPGGQYAIRLTNVTPASLIGEVEPGPGIPDIRDNTTQVILPDDTARGRIDFPDEDSYAFDITTAPAIACFEVTGYRNGVDTVEDAYLDPSLTLYDSDGATMLADGQTDADIDDYIFSDPKLCYRFDTADTYFITVDSSLVLPYTSSGDYFLDYTLVDSGFTAGLTTNVDSATAQQVVDGEWINGSINIGGIDWYSYVGNTGDMIRISYFDGTSSQTETQSITAVELRNPGTGNLVYASDDPAPLTTGPGAFTIRGIPNAGSLSSATSTYFFTLSGPANTDYSVKFEKFRAAQSTGLATSQNTLEIQDVSNNTIGTLTSERLDSNEYGAGDMDGVVDVDSFRFNAVAGEFITINVYADQPFNSNDTGDKAQDLSGHGSVFEPILRVYKSPDTVPLTDAIAISRFDPSQIQNTGFDIATEGVNDFLPTISLTFEVPETNLYYMTLSAENFFSGSTYFFEVIRN